jgi:predicted CopG family antitoxin
MSGKVISISEENYQALKKLGLAGDSINFVVGKLLRIAAGEVLAGK